MHASPVLFVAGIVQARYSDLTCSGLSQLGLPSSSLHVVNFFLLPLQRLVHCKSCGVAGGPAWIMTSGRHHGWSCPRYSYTDVTELHMEYQSGSRSVFSRFWVETDTEACVSDIAVMCCSPQVFQAPSYGSLALQLGLTWLGRAARSCHICHEAGECRFCAFVGEVSMVTSNGPHHLRLCQRQLVKRD